MASIFDIAKNVFSAVNPFDNAPKKVNYPSNFIGPIPGQPNPVPGATPTPMQQQNNVLQPLYNQPAGPSIPPTLGPTPAQPSQQGGQVLGTVSGGGQARPAQPQQPAPSQLNLNLSNQVPTAGDVQVPEGLLASTNGRTSGQLQQQIDEFSYDSLLQPAIDALSQFEGTLQSGLQNELGGIGNESAGIISGIRGGQQEAVSTLDAQKAGAEDRAASAEKGVKQDEEAAVSEQRRLLDEANTGLQARFGGTTGTGRFASEIANRGAFANIGNIRAAAIKSIESNRLSLGNTVREIETARNNIVNQANRLVTQEEQRVSQMKSDAQQRLKEQLAQIALQKGQLEGRKAEARLNALKEARDIIAGIEAENRTFKQRAYETADSYVKNLENMKNQAQIQFQMALQENLIPPRQVEVLTANQALQRGSIPENAQIISGSGGAYGSDLQGYISGLLKDSLSGKEQSGYQDYEKQADTIFFGDTLGGGSV